MSKLSAVKQLALQKNWSIDDLAQIVGYVMMGENPAFIADRLFVCERDVREIVQETLAQLTVRNFHDHAARLGFIARPSTSPKQEKPQPWKKRGFSKVPRPKPVEKQNLTARFFGDPPPERSALANSPPVKLNYEKPYSTKLAKTKENSHEC